MSPGLLLCPPPSPAPVLRLQMHTATMPGFSVGAGAPNPGPHTCAVNTFPLSHFPSPFIHAYFFIFCWVYLFIFFETGSYCEGQIGLRLMMPLPEPRSCKPGFPHPFPSQSLCCPSWHRTSYVAEASLEVLIFLLPTTGC